MLKTAKIKKSGQFSDFTTVRRIGHLFSAKWQLNTTFNNAWKMDIFWKIGCLKPVIADSDPERTSQALKMHSPPSCPLHLQFGAHHLDLKSCCQDCWLPMEKGSKSGPGRVFSEWHRNQKLTEFKPSSNLPFSSETVLVPLPPDSVCAPPSQHHHFTICYGSRQLMIVISVWNNA